MPLVRIPKATVKTTQGTDFDYDILVRTDFMTHAVSGSNPHGTTITIYFGSGLHISLVASDPEALLQQLES